MLIHNDNDEDRLSTIVGLKGFQAACVFSVSSDVRSKFDLCLQAEVHETQQ